MKVMLGLDMVLQKRVCRTHVLLALAHRKATSMWKSLSCIWDMMTEGT